MTKTKTTLEYRDPSQLRNHPLSIALYGERLDQEFLDAVRLAGRILEPIRILPNGTIISGRRRRIAACKFGFARVPCIVDRELTTELDIEESIILANRANERTMEMRAREGKHLLAIEQKRAAARKTHASVPRPGEPTGEAKDIVASAVGLSRHTLDKAIDAVTKADELTAAGESEKAAQIINTMNGSVAAAHRLAQRLSGQTSDETVPKESKEPTDALGLVIPEKLRESFAISKQLHTLARQVSSIAGQVDEMHARPGGERIPVSHVRVDLQNLRGSITIGMPWAVCSCRGRGCKKCDQLGWLTKNQAKGITADDAARLPGTR